jgi:hypothetical protein
MAGGGSPWRRPCTARTPQTALARPPVQIPAPCQLQPRPPTHAKPLAAPAAAPLARLTKVSNQHVRHFAAAPVLALGLAARAAAGPASGLGWTRERRRAGTRQLRRARDGAPAVCSPSLPSAPIAPLVLCGARSRGASIRRGPTSSPASLGLYRGSRKKAASMSSRAWVNLAAGWAAGTGLGRALAAGGFPAQSAHWGTYGGRGSGRGAARGPRLYLMRPALLGTSGFSQVGSPMQRKCRAPTPTPPPPPAPVVCG